MAIRRSLIAYAQITFGTLLSALAVNLFMVPTHLPSGGLSGLMLIFNYLWGLPVGPAFLIANVPAILWLFKVKGWEGGAKSVYGIISFSLLVQLTVPLSAYAPTQNTFLAVLFGGLLMGTGVGLTLIVGGDAGGNSTYARLIRHYTGMNVAGLMLGMDFLILAFGAVMLSVESVLYALAMTVVISYSMQMVMDSLNASRFILIISEKSDAVGAAIMAEVRRGVTRLDGRGEFTGRDRPVLMCAVYPSEVLRVKRLVLEADPEAFMLVSDAREVSGRGFTLEHEVRRLPYWATMGTD
ncbi:MAG TPA: YitT family protein [Symbiobacteriaceae bacterium]|nr:YitT family protein [Symbiobacteriaceae bacterium]